MTVDAKGAGFFVESLFCKAGGTVVLDAESPGSDGASGGPLEVYAVWCVNPRMGLNSARNRTDFMVTNPVDASRACI